MRRLSMSDKVALVSGGSRGLGKAFVAGLLENGYRVATFSRSAGSFTDEIMRAHPDRVFYRSLDQTSAPSLQLFVKDTVTRFGRLDVLVNNAGIAREGLVALMDEAAIDELMSVNLAAAIKLTKYCTR